MIKSTSEFLRHNSTPSIPFSAMIIAVAKSSKYRESINCEFLSSSTTRIFNFLIFLKNGY